MEIIKIAFTIICLTTGIGIIKICFDEYVKEGKDLIYSILGAFVGFAVALLSAIPFVI